MMKVRVPPRISPSSLEHAAMHYLERFAASTASLRRVLMRKIDRSLAHWGGERTEAAALADAVIARLTGLGYLNDEAYAEQKVRSLHRRGKGGRAIRASLAAKGVGGELAEAALSALADETPEPDRQAAIHLARRRRLGPFRTAARAENRSRDLAALARAGFDFETARAVIDAPTIDHLTEDTS
jgi:regulatory protein